MKLVCSGVHFSESRGPDMGTERGRNQKGMAESRVMTPAMRYPSHQAPTQRASAGVIVMVSALGETKRMRDNQHSMYILDWNCAVVLCQ